MDARIHPATRPPRHAWLRIIGALVATAAIVAFMAFEVDGSASLLRRDAPVPTMTAGRSPSSSPSPTASVPTATPSAAVPSSVAAPSTPSAQATQPLDQSTSAAQAQAAAFGKLGMNQGFQSQDLPDAQLATLFSSIRATGSTVIRLDLPWQQIQPDNATTFDFSNVIRVYSAAQAAGLTVLPVTSGMPSWAGSVTPTSPAYYENFLYQAGRTLIPLGVTTVEIWNEPNLTGITPAAYTTRALIPGATGFRQAAAELGATVSIVSGGLSQAVTANGTYSPVDFLTGVYAAGGKGYFDAVGDHPYEWPADPTVPSRYNWLLNAPALHDVMVANGDTTKQIWATEFGFPTNTGSRGVSEALQAQYIVAGAKIWAAYPWAGPMLFYSYQDLTARDSDPEHNFGLVRVDGTGKPALQAVESYIASR